MPKKRLDQAMFEKGLVPTRSQAESYIKLGKVTVNQRAVTKAGFTVNETDAIRLNTNEQYVSRAGLKLSSVSDNLGLNFSGKIVLDVGSSTGGFTDFALQHGAKQVIAVDVGTNQLHSSLRNNEQIELHEKTDIRDFKSATKFDLILIDVSFISLRDVLPSIAKLADQNTDIVAMCKPQFEAGNSAKHKGVIKNDKFRRNTLKDFENWTQNLFIIAQKADSEVTGAKGNLERFYRLKLLKKSL